METPAVAYCYGCQRNRIPSRRSYTLTHATIHTVLRTLSAFLVASPYFHNPNQQQRHNDYGIDRLPLAFNSSNGKSIGIRGCLEHQVLQHQIADYLVAQGSHCCKIARPKHLYG
eukprot:GHVU01015144.1.p1 GENE.GHVU01015144.1~~GHVU01015144.1.p1  ORF type:complete len:114 (+),score=1.97 GHVU01015144.1:517-858(+)